MALRRTMPKHLAFGTASAFGVLAFLIMACLSGLALAAEEPPPADSKTLEKVAELIQTMDGSNFCEEPRSRDPIGINKIIYLRRGSASGPRAD